MLLICLFLVVIWLLLVFEAPRWGHTLAAAMFLLNASWCGGGWGLFLLWGLFVVAALLLNFAVLRKPLLTKPVLGLFRQVMPNLSATEQAALDAGDVWWDGDLFSGRPDWGKLLSIAPAALSDEEQAFRRTGC